MIRTYFLLLLAVLFLLPCSGSTHESLYAQDRPAAAPVAHRYASDIDAFLKEDSIAPPPKHAILFIGSSIFRKWTHLREQMAPLPVFNRAFGGSRTGDLLYYMDKIVLPYTPDMIVYYCGSNDVNANEHAAAIFGRFKQFTERVKAALPKTSVYFVSINRAPQKQDRWDVVDSTNAMVKNYCAETDGVHYIDVNPVLFDSAMQPRLDLYLKDKLHFQEQAYDLFTAVIRPIIEKAWKSSNHPN